MKITRNKITPITNPNYQLKETPQELIEILINSGNIPVVATNLKQVCNDGETFKVNDNDVLGYVSYTCYEPTLDEDEFIYADITWYKDEYQDYQWANCKYEVDYDMNITRFLCVQYERVQ